MFKIHDSYFILTVPCDVLSAANNGTIGAFSNGTHTMASFTCDVGTTLNGSMSSVCLNTGQWDDVPPDCGKL